MKWISVKDKLPSDNEEVLVCTFYQPPASYKLKLSQFIMISSWSKILKRWSYPEDQCYEKVTHWMPLPKLPKYEKETTSRRTTRRPKTV